MRCSRSRNQFYVN
ncbi:Protein of unknown function [Pyronema omphalodes CBS 100304]|uniref:Uncharacterized protein n=1 Tax=Pyronema omphalodes (strain CBS 100304) TaxID=1076935 RepID=U4L5W8_PYROM|nr:Protein of unknown function [Pyronema omphalodes CBS 100304]